MGRPRITPFSAAIVAAALLAPGAAAPAPPPKLPEPKLYDVRITGTHETKFINAGCDPYCADGYQGTHTWTQTFTNVRTAYSRFGSGIALYPRTAFKGRSAERYDHQSSYCEHETPAITRAAELALSGLVGQSPSMALRGQSTGAPTGDPVACASRAEAVAFASRIGTTLVSGSSRDGYTTLSFRIKPTKAGPGFPLDRLIAGEGFTIPLKGRSIVNQADLRLKKWGYSTTGSVRVVFVPRKRS